MRRWRKAANVGRWGSCLTAFLGGMILTLIGGCPPGVPTDTPSNGNANGGGGGGGGASGSVGATIDNTTTNFSINRLATPVSVVYSVTGTPDSINAFFVSTAVNSVPQLLLGENGVPLSLPAGDRQQFRFDPSVADVGTFRVGIIVRVNGEDRLFTSAGIITVEGPPAPFFTAPPGDITEVVSGQSVTVRFDAGDPENKVQWRLFVLEPGDARDVSPDLLGRELDVGSGNAGVFFFSTADLAPGDYVIGLSATDTGFSILQTVSQGNTDQIVTIPGGGIAGRIIRILPNKDDTARPPTITITEPGSAGVLLFGDEEFTIKFSAEIQEEGATGTIDLFYDDDRVFENGFAAAPFATNLSASVTSFPLPTNLPEGEFFIGASVNDGINPVVSTYATGSVSVVRTPTLVVTKPVTSLPIGLSAPGGTPNTILVEWSTNVPPAAGSVDVFARALDSSGAETGFEIPVLGPSSTDITTALFSSVVSGQFQITVRITFDASIDLTSLALPQCAQVGDPSIWVCTQTAPVPVRVSSLPPIAWLGSLAQPFPTFEGAIFEGVNFEDNAGTSFSTAGDLDGDNLDEFVIAARYGKPFFVNPTGVGPGEAYLIYGSTGAQKLVGEWNLNSVGTVGLRGLFLTGIQTVGNSDDTDGMSDVTLIPDADSDGKGEIAFGFPRVNSAGGTAGILESAGQFLNGGVVILSSNSSILASPTAGSSVINLSRVGQVFSDMTVQPGNIDVAVIDGQQFQAANPTATPPTPDMCIGGTDGVLDTIIGPSSGFISFLAPPLWQQLGFVPFSGAPAVLLCPTQFDLADCGSSPFPFSGSNAGSGFYPASATPISPRGARILGPNTGDAFGTSITASNPLGNNRPGDLIISAPKRSARASLVAGISSDIVDSGVAFLNDNRNLWGTDNVFSAGQTPPTPHQYIMGVVSHCGDNRAAPLSNPLRIAGDVSDSIENILGIDDFNADGRNDFAVAAPDANGGQGRVYIAFRRDEAIEGDFVLEKLSKAPDNPERLSGVLLTATSADGFGSSLATGVDFNGDGVSDLVIGSPDAGNGVGEVIIVFGDRFLVSPLGGKTLDDLLVERTVDNRPRAVRITGNALDINGRFGFNIANAGDVDGDGRNDLLVSAPNSSPRFDPDPSDEFDELTETGLDLNFDGFKDDVTGPQGVRDNVVDTLDDLTDAGIVYVISGRNRFDILPPANQQTISISALGSSDLRGFMIVGRRPGDRIGGGDAGEVGQGGIMEKTGRGRSRGLASAGDVDGDGRADILIGSILADPRIDPNNGQGVQNGGEAYLIYGSVAP